MHTTSHTSDTHITAPAASTLEPGDMLVALGNELRRAREDRSLTRAEIVERLGSAIRSQTLATYEQGTRQCTVSRFVDICQAIGVSAPDLLTHAMQKASIDLRSLTLRVDVALIATDQREEIRPLQQWARNLIKSMEPTEVRLVPAEVALLAVFCDLAHEDMARLLLDFSPES